jgi:hypothetical protein
MHAGATAARLLDASTPFVRAAARPFSLPVVPSLPYDAPHRVATG